MDVRSGGVWNDTPSTHGTPFSHFCAPLHCRLFTVALTVITSLYILFGVGGYLVSCTNPLHQHTYIHMYIRTYIRYKQDHKQPESHKLQNDL